MGSDMGRYQGCEGFKTFRLARAIYQGLWSTL